MLTSSIKPYALIPIALWQYTFVRFVLMLILLLFSMAIAFAGILAKYRKAYQQGRITSALLIRNTAFEIIGLLAVTILAGWLGRATAQMVAQQIGNEMVKFIVGLTIGLLVGIGVGIAANQLGANCIYSENRSPR